MKLIQGIKIIFFIAGMLMLTACAHKRGTNQAAINDANAAYGSSPGAQASGLGEETRFGERNSNYRVARSGSSRVYYFDFDSYIVHNDDKPSIYANANYLISHPNLRVMLEGHTDPRGSREYNIGLGERRAKAVAAILTSRGVNPRQIRVVSYGAEKLASLGHNEAAFQKDRRVVVVYLQR